MQAAPESRPLIAMEAEHGVLGALMRKPELCEEVGAFLSPAEFSTTDNSVLYSLILAARSKGLVPDSITLSEIRSELPSGEMTIVYASELMANVPSASNGLEYARIVSERAASRKLHEVGIALMGLATSRGKLADQVSQAQSLVMSLNAKDDRPDVIQLWEAMIPVVDDMDNSFNGKKKEMGLQFGLTDLDNIINGLRPGNLCIVAGRPGTGKTVLGVGLAEKVALRDNSASLIFSLEMSSAELAKRALSSVSSVSQRQIETGQALSSEEETARITGSVARIRKADMRVCERGGIPFSRLCAIARLEHRVKPLSVIVIDYLTLIAADPGSRFQNRNQEIGSFTRGLKALAKELNIPIVVLAQLNRGIENRVDAKPKMSDLRDSGEIEQDADVIIMAHRDMDSEHGQNGITEMNVVKVRHASPGFCLLQFQGDMARFVNAAYVPREEQQETARRPVRKSARSMMEAL